MSHKSDSLAIAVIGGGTGTSTLLRELKKVTSNISALVNMVDDGGSTGILRNELGVLPPGDIRQCLVGLSNSPDLEDLFTYRFDNGSLKGHAFGNLFLAALEKKTGDFAHAVALASNVLNITGSVIPLTLKNTSLVLNDSGKKIKGQYAISRHKLASPWPRLQLEPNAPINAQAYKAIMQADIVIIAPGNLYASLAPALLVQGVGEALQKTKALKAYVCNLATFDGQTGGFSVADFAKEVERFADAAFLDVVFYNTNQSAHNKNDHVAIDQYELRGAHYTAIGHDLVLNKVWKNPNEQSDPIVRTTLRHNAGAVVRALIDYYYN